MDDRFDALVIGAGPAGSIAALVLARGGARVAMVDKATFPREKACGDLVGPRGVQILNDLGLDLAGAVPVGDMIVVGPTGRRVRLPCYPGQTYPGYAVAMPRARLDHTLFEAALAAGATAFSGRAAEPLSGPAGLEGFVLAGGQRLRADVVIGADGAVSRVRDAAGLVDNERVLWGFALRGYVAQPVAQPNIVFWENSARRALPGYGWLFPGPDGQANFGLGIGTLGDRTSAAHVHRLMPDFLAHLGRLGLLDVQPSATDRQLGGWLKMGMIGTRPAAKRVLLCGDAAGLVNPFQGEGIAQAMGSAVAAAQAVLAGPATAAERYRADLRARHLPFHRVAAATQAMLLPRRRAIALAGRLLTLPGVERALGGGWSLFWNELVDGARPSYGRRVARAAGGFGRMVTARSPTRRWLDDVYG